MINTVLLAGATGMLGSRIADHLLRLPLLRLRLLVRNPGAKEHLLGPLVSRAAELIHGDLASPASLDRATRGVDVIVSAVQGGAEVIVEGQVALAKAGKANGVRRMLPSDYALDLFRATTGEHAAFDMRAQADARIASIGIEQVNVLQGAFMEMLMPGRGAIDLAARTISFFGDGERLIEVTSVEDTARMIARIAVDRAVKPGKVAFAGDRISFCQAGEIVARAIGRPIRPISLGSEADLRAAMAEADPKKRVMLAYLLYMSNGQTSLSDLQSDRYADLVLQTFEAFVLSRLEFQTARESMCAQ